MRAKTSERRMMAAAFVVFFFVASSCTSPEISTPTSGARGTEPPETVPSVDGQVGEDATLCPRDATDTTSDVAITDINGMIASGTDRSSIRQAATAYLGSDYGGMWFHQVNGERRLAIATAGDLQSLAVLDGADGVAVEFSIDQLKCFSRVFHARVKIANVEANEDTGENQPSGNFPSALASSSYRWKENRVHFETTQELAPFLDLSGIPESAYNLEVWTREGDAGTPDDIVSFGCETTWPGHGGSTSFAFAGDAVTNGSDDEQRGTLTAVGRSRLNEVVSGIDVSLLPQHYEGERPPPQNGTPRNDDLFQRSCHLTVNVRGQHATFTWDQWPPEELIALQEFLIKEIAPLAFCRSTESIKVTESCEYQSVI